MNLAERRPSLKVEPDQFPFSDDPARAAREWAKRHHDSLITEDAFRREVLGEGDE